MIFYNDITGFRKITKFYIIGYWPDFILWNVAKFRSDRSKINLSGLYLLSELKFWKV